MAIVIDASRRVRGPSASPRASIREVCLVSSRRAYVSGEHVSLAGGLYEVVAIEPQQGYLHVRPADVLKG